LAQAAPSTLTAMSKRRRHARARASRSCEVCGEEAKLHKLKMVLDGKPEVSWRLCRGCAAEKLVAVRCGRGRG
jgi:MinD superfamily P-loop ATPase